MESGKWKVESGKWKVESRERPKFDDIQSVVSEGISFLQR